jgi:2-polyprenyl-6-methoxyphenol hydroxylase-like FAD-dependent oxidoreductase
VDLLARWDVLDRITASDCPRLDRITYGLGDVVLEGPAPTLGVVEGTFAPKRSVLDGALVDAAVEAGAEFRDRSKLVGLVWNDDRVTGVRYEDRDGHHVVESARLVVGADGMRSTVAGLTGAPLSISTPPRTCVYYLHWVGLDTGFEFHERTGNWIAVIPTNDGETIVASYFPQEDFPRIRTDVRTAYRTAITTTAPALAERLTGARQVGRLRGSGDQRNFFRVPTGPGWALVGDAGHHKDSITARGMADGLLQVRLLVDSLGPDLADRAAVAAGSEAFRARRDQVLAEPYRSTLATAELKVSSGKRDLLRAISGSAESTKRYFEVVAGTASVDDLLTPELLGLL